MYKKENLFHEFQAAQNIDNRGWLCRHGRGGLRLYLYVLSVQQAERVYAIGIESISVTPQPLKLSGFFVFKRPWFFARGHLKI